MSLDPLQSLLLAFGCLLAGRFVTRRVTLLSRYNVPVPVTGGLLFAVLAALGSAAGNVEMSIDDSLKPVLLLMFFGGVGLSADLRLLARGGRELLRFMLVLAPFIVLQNLLGIGVASLLDLHPTFGLLAGSITLVGGHGTGAAYAERFAEVQNLQSITELAMTSATVGLILGGVIAGPVAQFLITRHRLLAASSGVGESAEASVRPVSADGLLLSLAGVLLAVIGGQWITGLTAGLPLTIPSFLWCMVIGVALRNIMPLANWRFEDRASQLVSAVTLALFLVMTMMTLDLVKAALSAGPLLLILLVQATFTSLFAVWVTYRALGRDYEAAVGAAAFIGFGMGTTATAVANMDAVMARHGPAPMTMVVVPLVGAFFVDIVNASILSAFLSFYWLGG